MRRCAGRSLPPISSALEKAADKDKAAEQQAFADKLGKRLPVRASAAATSFGGPPLATCGIRAVVTPTSNVRSRTFRLRRFTGHTMPSSRREADER